MSRTRMIASIGILGVMAGSAATFSHDGDWPKNDYVLKPNWCPGNGCAGANILAQHETWHMHFSGTREFLEFHREFIAQADDFRLYGFDTPFPIPDSDPDPAVFEVVPRPASSLEFPHIDTNNNFSRPAVHVIDAPPLAHTDPGNPVGQGGVQSSWTVRPANLTFGNATFCGYTVSQFGSAMNGLFHGEGHQTIGKHNTNNTGPGDMVFFTSPRDPAFFQWHKHIDNIYSDWAVSNYQ